jgi:hypothetical protein
MKQAKKDILDALLEEWEVVPELRLGQLIVNALSEERGGDSAS